MRLVTINRPRKDSCENAHVCYLLPLIGIHGVYSQVQPTPVVNWDKHALDFNAHQVHQLCK